MQSYIDNKQFICGNTLFYEDRKNIFEAKLVHRINISCDDGVQKVILQSISKQVPEFYLNTHLRPLYRETKPYVTEGTVNAEQNRRSEMPSYLTKFSIYRAFADQAWQK